MKRRICFGLIFFAVGLPGALAFALDPGKVSSYSCSGTEPFWGMTISPSKIEFENAGEEKKILLKAVKPEEAQGIQPGHVRVYRSGDAAGRPVTAVIKYAESGCSDGMSDNLHPFSIEAIFPDRAFTGCCEPKK